MTFTKCLLFDNKVRFVMNALFHRRVYRPFATLTDRLMTVRHYNSVRTLKTVITDCHVLRPLSSVVGHERMTCPVYCSDRRHLSDDVHSHNDRFESAADGRWSNRCNCCGLNSKGSSNYRKTSNRSRVPNTSRGIF